MRRPQTQSFHSLPKTRKKKIRPSDRASHSLSYIYLYRLSLSHSLISWLLGCNGTVLYGCNTPRQASRQAGRQAIKPPQPPIPTLIYPPNTLGEKQRASQTRGFNVTKERMPMGKEETKGKTDEREGKKENRTGQGRGGGAALAHLA